MLTLTHAPSPLSLTITSKPPTKKGVGSGVVKGFLNDKDRLTKDPKSLRKVKVSYGLLPVNVDTMPRANIA